MKPLVPQSNDRPRRGRVAAAGLAALLVFWLAVGCSPLRLLGPKQRLLTKVTVESNGLTQAQQERMLTLVQQKPNRNLPLPKLAIYQLGHAFYDTTRIERHIAAIQQKYAAEIAKAGTDSARVGRLAIRRDRRLDRKRTVLEKGNAIMRLGEPPVIYDPSLSARTVEQLTTYLHAQGYFRARVRYDDTARAKRSPGGIFRHLLGSKPAQGTPLRDSLTGQRLHRRVAVTYVVQEGPDFTYSQLARIVPDSGVARLIRRGQEATLLHLGDAYNEDQIGLERQRLETLLKNAGYYDFRAQLISFEADTSFEKQHVRLRMVVASPPGGLRPYYLRQVTLLTDVGRSRALRAVARDTAQLPRRRRGRLAVADTAAARVATNANRTGRISTASLPAGVTPAAVSDSMTASRLRRQGRRIAPRDTARQDSVLILSRGPLQISPKVLVRQITLRPDQRFNLTRTQRTQRQLSALDMFQFNTVSYRKVDEASRVSFANVARDTVEVSAAADTLRPTPSQPATLAASGAPPGYLDATITTSPSPRFSETTEFGGTYVASKVGPFANLRLKWRNPFGGAEVLELSGRLGLEGQLARLGDLRTEVGSYYTLQYGASAALVVPQFLVPFRLGSFLRNDQPRTRFLLSNTYTKTPYYTRSNTEFTLDYLWQTSTYQQYIFTPFDVGIVSVPHVEPIYTQTLDSLRRFQGSPLYQSFRPVFEPSFSFTSLYNSNDINQTKASAHYLRYFIELGGLTRGLYRDAKWFRDTDLSVYNFAKIAIDYRRYYKLSASTYLAWRLNGGAIRALTPTPNDRGESEYILPYDKYFFAGGSNSVRAWSPRRLGIGSYATRLYNRTTMQYDGDRDYITEQPGNVLLEGSVEYRFPVYSFIRGALFTDFGNVWSLQPDDTRHDQPGNGDARFHFDSFYKQFAVASGIGIRMDFTFIILRFDIATKVYDPTSLSSPWLIRQALRQTTNQTIINVGIGYPF